MFGGKMVVDKYCDLVMKGGIISGIVYFNVVLVLVCEYWFKSIGGIFVGVIVVVVVVVVVCGDCCQQVGEYLFGDVGYGGLLVVLVQLLWWGFIYSLF